MTKTQRRKYDRGRARKSRYLEKRGRLSLECGVHEYLTESGEAVRSEEGPAVLTIPATRLRGEGGDGTQQQMLLFDSPVAVVDDPAWQTAEAPEQGMNGLSTRTVASAMTESETVTVSETGEADDAHGDPASSPPAEKTPPVIVPPRSGIAPTSGPSLWRTQNPTRTGFTWKGFAKGCGGGLAAAVVILALYALLA